MRLFRENISSETGEGLGRGLDPKRSSDLTKIRSYSFSIHVCISYSVVRVYLNTLLKNFTS